MKRAFEIAEVPYICCAAMLFFQLNQRMNKVRRKFFLPPLKWVFHPTVSSHCNFQRNPISYISWTSRSLKMTLKILTQNTGHSLQSVLLYPFSTFHYCSVSCAAILLLASFLLNFHALACVALNLIYSRCSRASWSPLLSTLMLRASRAARSLLWTRRLQKLEVISNR